MRKEICGFVASPEGALCAGVSSLIISAGLLFTEDLVLDRVIEDGLNCQADFIGSSKGREITLRCTAPDNSEFQVTLATDK